MKCAARVLDDGALYQIPILGIIRGPLCYNHTTLLSSMYVFIAVLRACTQEIGTHSHDQIHCTRVTRPYY